MWYFYYFVPLVLVGSFIFMKYRNYIREKFIQLAVSIVFRVSTRMYSAKESVEVHKRYMKVPYTYNGTKYNLYVPFSRVARRKMLNTKCTLFNKDGTFTDITQQPGCCYLVSVDMLEGDKIVFEDFNEGIKTKFTGDDIPVIS